MFSNGWNTKLLNHIFESLEKGLKIIRIEFEKVEIRTLDLVKKSQKLQW